MTVGVWAFMQLPSTMAVSWIIIGLGEFLAGSTILSLIVKEKVTPRSFHFGYELRSRCDSGTVDIAIIHLIRERQEVILSQFYQIIQASSLSLGEIIRFEVRRQYFDPADKNMD